MKKTLLYFLILLLPLSGYGLDNLSRIKQASISGQIGARKMNRQEEKRLYTSMIIEVEDDSAFGFLEEIGAVIVRQRENLLLAYVPDDMLGELDKIHKVTGCAASRRANPNLDRAVKTTNVPRVLSGEAFSMPFTGRGVTVGFSDLGFDPNHAAFAGRVKAVVHSVDSTATIVKAETPSEIADWTSDTYDNFHATHVGGILAGADKSSVYQGVARGSEIVATTSTLDDVGILIGVEEIISRAKADNQPAVINLSLGTTLGPHDGTDLFCQYLDLCAEDAAILLSAGNDGETPMYATKVLSIEDDTVTTMLESGYWNDVLMLNGYVDIWSSDSRPFKTRLKIWDLYERKEVYSTDWIDATEGVFVLDSAIDAAFGNHYDGVVISAAELSSHNGRYNATFGFSMKSKESYPSHSYSRYDIIIETKGAPGAKIDLCADGSLRFFEKMADIPQLSAGTSDLSISSMACGKNTICVGSATTRDKAPLLSGGESSWAGFVNDGTVSKFSSYGTTSDGRSLPHFCAPGAYVVSAYNRYVVEKYPEIKAQMAAESPDHPGHYYYSECGTSMASPHAAGIFALWLEASPDLSGKELREIAMQTARYEGLSADDPRSGAGMIDATAGMAYILQMNGLHEEAEAFVKVWRIGNELRISGIEPSNVSAEVYTLDGRAVYSGNPAHAVLPASPLIVVLRIAESTITRKLP